MTPEFVALCIAAVAVTAFLSSGLIGAMIFVGEGWIGRLAPAAQSRLFLAAAVAPALVAFAAVGVVNFDVLILECDVHSCRGHRAGMPSALVLLIAGVLASRLGVAVVKTIAGAYRSRSLGCALASVASQTSSGLWIVPIEEVSAFVVGILRPQIYISQGLLSSAEPRDLKSVLAHERSHVRRRDPLRRLVASLALAFHLPGVARGLNRRLARSQEIAADAAGAREIGDASRFAEALVRLTRLRAAHPALGMAFLGSDVEARVRELLVPARRPDQPRGALLVGVAIGLLVVALFAVETIHSGAETLLGLLGS